MLEEREERKRELERERETERDVSERIQASPESTQSQSQSQAFTLLFNLLQNRGNSHHIKSFHTHCCVCLLGEALVGEVLTPLSRFTIQCQGVLECPFLTVSLGWAPCAVPLTIFYVVDSSLLPCSIFPFTNCLQAFSYSPLPSEVTASGCLYRF